MLGAPGIAIDLPLKILVWEDIVGKVWVSYNSPTYLQERHGIPRELEHRGGGDAGSQGRRIASFWTPRLRGEGSQHFRGLLCAPEHSPVPVNAPGFRPPRRSIDAGKHPVGAFQA